MDTVNIELALRFTSLVVFPIDLLSLIECVEYTTLFAAGASHCCAGTIEASGTKCGQPPCIPDPEFYNAPSPTSAPVDPYTMCSSRGGIISADHTVCCSQSCGTCGGVGCDSRDGGKVQAMMIVVLLLLFVCLVAALLKTICCLLE